MLFFISLLSAMLFTVVLMFLTTSAGVASSSQFPTVQMSERFIDMLFGFAQVFLFFWLYAPCLWIFSYNAVDYVAAFALSDDHPEGTTSTAHALTRRPGCCHHAPHDYKRVLRLISPLTLLLFLCTIGMLILFILNKEDPDWPSGIFPVILFATCLLYLLVPYLPPLAATRMAFAGVLGKSLCAMVYPLFGFDFSQLIVSDCLTSASLTLYQLELVGCFTFTGEFVRDSYVDLCGSGSNKLVAQPIMYCFPYWIRFVQCVYMYWTTREPAHLLNAGKYMTGIVAVLASFVSNDSGTAGVDFWFVFYIVMISLKTLYCILWDTYMDFDLGHRPTTKGEFPFFLRAQRAYSSTGFYYWALISNAIMRCSFAIALTTSVPYNWGMLMAVVEIFRRAQWILLRVEVKHFELLNQQQLDDEEAEENPLLLDQPSIQSINSINSS